MTASKNIRIIRHEAVPQTGSPQNIRRDLALFTAPTTFRDSAASCWGVPRNRIDSGAKKALQPSRLGRNRSCAWRPCFACCYRRVQVVFGQTHL